MHACTCNCVIEFQRGGVVLFPLTSVCGIRSLTNKWNESYQYIMYTPGMSCLVPSSNVHLCSLCSDVWKCISVWWILLALLGFNFDYFFFLSHTHRIVSTCDGESWDKGSCEVIVFSPCVETNVHQPLGNKRRWERERGRGIEKGKNAGFLSMGSKGVLVLPLATACPSTCVIINYTRASMLSYKVKEL